MVPRNRHMIAAGPEPVYDATLLRSVFFLVPALEDLRPRALWHRRMPSSSHMAIAGKWALDTLKYALFSTLAFAHSMSSMDRTSDLRNHLAAHLEDAQRGPFNARVLGIFEDQERVLVDALLRIRKYRNACTPFLCLPKEIISAIVELAAEVDTYYPGSRRTFPSDTLLSLTATCTALNSVAYGLPHLWSVIPARNPLATSRYTSRAGASGLTLRVFDEGLGKPTASRVLALLSTLASRISVIDTQAGIDALTDVGAQVLASLHVVDLPALRSLHVAWAGDVTVEKYPASIVPLTTTLASGGALEFLTCLELRHCGFIQLTTLPRNLHRLTLFDTFGDDRTPDRLIRALAKLSKLKTLYLTLVCSELARASEWWDGVTERGALPALCELYVNAPRHVCANILARIRLPPTCDVYADAHRNPERDAELCLMFITALVRHSQQSGIRPWRRATFAEELDTTPSPHGSDRLQIITRDVDSPTLCVDVEERRLSGRTFVEVLNDTDLARGIRRLTLKSSLAPQTAPPFRHAVCVEFIVHTYDHRPDQPIPELTTAVRILTAYRELENIIWDGLLVTSEHEIARRQLGEFMDVVSNMKRTITVDFTRSTLSGAAREVLRSTVERGRVTVML